MTYVASGHAPVQIQLVYDPGNWSSVGSGSGWLAELRRQGGASATVAAATWTIAVSGDTMTLTLDKATAESLLGTSQQETYGWDLYDGAGSPIVTGMLVQLRQSYTHPAGSASPTGSTPTGVYHVQDMGSVVGNVQQLTVFTGPQGPQGDPGAAVNIDDTSPGSTTSTYSSAKQNSIYVPQQTTAPDHTVSPVWMDTSTTPGVLKAWNGSAWASILGATIDDTTARTTTVYSSTKSNATFVSITSRGEEAEAFGTIGSGDDTTPMQAAIDACAAYGGRLMLRAGRSYIASVLSMKSFTGIQGGPNTTITQKAGTTGHLISLADATQVQVWIEDLKIDGNSSNQTNANDAINLDHASGDATLVARHRVRNVFIRNAKGNGLYLGVFNRDFEGNLISVYNCDGYGVVCAGADSKLSNVDVAQSGLAGWNITGSAYVISTTKSWYSGRIDNAGGGYILAGDKNLLTGAYSQDNMGHGFQIFRSGQTVVGTQLVGATSENDNSNAGSNVGFSLFGAVNSVIVGVVKIYSGGRSGVPLRALSVDSASVGNEITLTSTGTSSFAVAGTGGGNTIRLTGRDGAVHAQAWAATITPNPLTAETFTTTLTASVTIANPSIKPAGWKLRYIFTQDATGGRTVSWGTDFLLNWSPNTAANKVNSVSFESDGTHWVQIGSYVSA